MAELTTWEKIRRLIPITRGAFVAFVILTLVNVGGFIQQGNTIADVKRLQQHDQAEARKNDLRLCRSSNEARQTLLDLFNDLRPLSEIRRPGETDEQYRFRLDQLEISYQQVNQRLAIRDCKSLVGDIPS